MGWAAHSLLWLTGIMAHVVGRGKGRESPVDKADDRDLEGLLLTDIKAEIDQL